MYENLKNSKILLICLLIRKKKCIPVLHTEEFTKEYEDLFKTTYNFSLVNVYTFHLTHSGKIRL